MPWHEHSLPKIIFDCGSLPLWSHQWTSRRTKFYCDNLGVVDVINSWKSNVPRVMDLVRDLTLCTLRYSFFFQAVHADSPSRFQMEHFRKLAPQFRASPDPIPRWVSTPSPNGEAQFYLGMALSQNTEKTYSSGMQQFYSFGSQTGITLTFPISEDILINFLVCMPQSIQHSTIKNYPP